MQTEANNSPTNEGKIMGKAKKSVAMIRSQLLYKQGSDHLEFYMFI